MNPYGQQSFPLPSASPSGAALASLGPSLTAGGNYLANSNFLQMLLRNQQMGAGGIGGVQGPANPQFPNG
jgi:hypothetical protein